MTTIMPFAMTIASSDSEKLQNMCKKDYKIVIIDTQVGKFI